MTAAIETKNGITTGTSDDGRIVYHSCSGGPVIEGRQAWRRHWTGADGRVDEAAGLVDDEMWGAACHLMRAVDDAHRRYSDDLRQRANDLHDGIVDRETETLRNVRGGPLDPNSY